MGAVITVLLVAASVMSACSKEDSASLGENTAFPAYVVSSPLATTNAASLLGSSTNAELVAGRLYPAVYTPGPNGQLIPNRDLAQARALPGLNRKVVYTIKDDAAFSDGTPVTCADFYLSFTAGRFGELFGSYLPWTKQVERVECLPGAKQFTVVFVEGQGRNWRQLFGPGEVLPAHAIAARAGLDEAGLVHRMDAADPAALGEVARVWSEGFRLDQFDPQLQASFGPYRIAEVGEHGEVRLEHNPHFNGNAALTAPLVVWPPTVDVLSLSGQARIVAADLNRLDESFVDRNRTNNPYDVYEVAGALTETLMLGSEGVFATPEDRDAFNACIDQEAVAAASSQASGVKVPPVGEHVVSFSDPSRPKLADLTAPRMNTDAQLASRLKGKTVRIGYYGPNKRKAQMVQAIKDSCAQAGIEVVDASALSGNLADVAGVIPGREAKVDALLKAVDPSAAYGEVGLGASGTAGLRRAEAELWQSVTAIPLSAQPRVFAVDRSMGNVSVYTGLAGIGWNMDRWRLD
ncbi:peptide ABC transporter [Corynebacterium atypicum]|uniref:Peptide ABC transporter n=1 Tax=Corynebacterium atypicum TaxID=191610 RepID=A0ABN4DFD5_9CORY|nr:peptide ABC transporter [Corynebacterium atypicum]